ncbi:DNA polymerase IV 1 domain protein [Mycobacterium kansasii]|nr:DNA polymerase IV 1 domain protein [Mycobacterium kansasii]OOK75515.1 DNA polymerase IV 1 domain protein [Mycobacterium kansasii]
MLPFDGEPPDVLDQAVDQIRRRFGKSALTRAVLIGRDPGVEMPRLPD